ncbi:hypothetical protein GE061_020210 [Apolygus lucorum]|uniref:Uncharacterized protein n=1 Tax=Apolygus lucorum TaxID=248454 RepID=A0A6A4K552_APOLU|nr:hypothetical protein GE061_020204 [Apolygus lucorum]KAF6197455.1 hypothetical protein GE061_020210 [Apolygus lucorum]
MPRHLISDAHEWINEIPSVPIYFLAKPRPRERAWNNQRGKKTLLSLTLVWYSEGVGRGFYSGLTDFLRQTPRVAGGRW